MQNVSAELSAAPARRPVHPFLFTLLVLPKGMAYGYVQVTLGYLLARGGVPVGQIAAVVAAGFLPYVLKFLWAPLVDTTLTYKKWYWLSVGSGALVLTGISLLPFNQGSVPLLTLGVFVLTFCFTFSSTAAAGLMAYGVPAALQGRAAGFFQMGSLGGNGLGGGLGLLLAQHLPVPGLAGILLGVVGLVCGQALRAFRDHTPTVHAERLTDTYRSLGRDVWATISTRSGLLGLLICVLPIGAAATEGLWSSVASEWHVGGDTVALVTGLLTSVTMAVGCLLGGWACDRVNPRYFTLLTAMAAGIVLVGMAYAPRTPAMFVGFTLLYTLMNGLCTAAGVTFIMEAIGQGAAATKFNIFVSLSNAPGYLMTFALGYAYTRFGSVGMLNTEFIFGVGSLVLYLLLQRVALRGRTPGWRRQLAAPELEPGPAVLLAG